MVQYFRKKNALEAEIQQDTAVSSSENENHTNIVAYMTTVSGKGAQNSGDTNTDGDREDAYQTIPDEFYEYSYAYTDVKGQKDTRLSSASKDSWQSRDHDTKTGNQASGEYLEPVEKKSEDGQLANIGLTRNELYVTAL